ncbi:MAG TPA: hypothetical protein VJS43_11445 [Candidatus Acidoferrales bacterium]|nr:hypothetical protein [Candidatus Acidoferrales bacterium]
MNGLNDRVRRFFEIYEVANREFDVEKISALYADVFVFGKPQGVQAVKKEDFVKVLPKRKEFFKTVGLVSSSVVSLDVSALDQNYALAKVVWNMRFERSPGVFIESENSATYVLLFTDDSAQIVFQLDHQDLMKKVKDLGLIK